MKLVTKYQAQVELGMDRRTFDSLVRRNRFKRALPSNVRNTKAVWDIDQLRSAWEFYRNLTKSLPALQVMPHGVVPPQYAALSGYSRSSIGEIYREYQPIAMSNPDPEKQANAKELLDVLRSYTFYVFHRHIGKVPGYLFRNRMDFFLQMLRDPEYGRTVYAGDEIVGFKVIPLKKDESQPYSADNITWTTQNPVQGRSGRKPNSATTPMQRIASAHKRDATLAQQNEAFVKRWIEDPEFRAQIREDDIPKNLLAILLQRRPDLLGQSATPDRTPVNNTIDADTRRLFSTLPEPTPVLDATLPVSPITPAGEVQEIPTDFFTTPPLPDAVPAPDVSPDATLPPHRNPKWMPAPVSAEEIAEQVGLPPADVAETVPTPAPEPENLMQLPRNGGYHL